MDLYTSLTAFAVAFVALAALAAVSSLALAGDFVVRNRRTRLARHQSVRTYYRGLVATH